MKILDYSEITYEEIYQCLREGQISFEVFEEFLEYVRSSAIEDYQFANYLN